MTARPSRQLPVVFWPAWSFALFVVLYFVVPADSALRYIVYLSPLLLATDAVLKRPVVAWRPALLIVIYLITAALSLVAFRSNSFFIRDVLITVLIMLPFALKFRVHRSAPYFLIVSAVICGLDAFMDNGGRLGELGIGLGQSEGLAETTFGFLTPLLCLYFVISRKRGAALICATLSLFMFKRIALASLVVAAAFAYIDHIAVGGTVRKIYRTALLTFLAALCLGSLYINSIYDLVIGPYNEYVKSGTSLDDFTSGRYQVYSFLWVNYLDHQDLYRWIFGNGVASTSVMMGQSAVASFSHLSLLHNEWLRMLVEYGVFGTCIVVAGLFQLSRHGPMAVASVVYTAMLFATDNVGMYVFYWTLVVILLRSSRTAENTDETQNTHPA